jgi:hypothetical protein
MLLHKLKVGAEVDVVRADGLFDVFATRPRDDKLLKAR